MIYVKNAVSYASYVEPHSRLTIKRGEVVAVEKLTEHMKRRVRKRGLVECEKAEYDAYLASKVPPKVVPADKVAKEAKAKKAELKAEKLDAEDSPRDAKPEAPKPAPRGKNKRGLKRK